MAFFSFFTCMNIFLSFVIAQIHKRWILSSLVKRKTWIFCKPPLHCLRRKSRKFVIGSADSLVSTIAPIALTNRSFFQALHFGSIFTTTPCQLLHTLRRVILSHLRTRHSNLEMHEAFVKFPSIFLYLQGKVFYECFKQFSIIQLGHQQPHLRALSGLPRTVRTLWTVRIIYGFGGTRGRGQYASLAVPGARPRPQAPPIPYGYTLPWDPARPEWYLQPEHPIALYHGRYRPPRPPVLLEACLPSRLMLSANQA